MADAALLQNRDAGGASFVEIVKASAATIEENPFVRDVDRLAPVVAAHFWIDPCLQQQLHDLELAWFRLDERRTVSGQDKLSFLRRRHGEGRRRAPKSACRGHAAEAGGADERVKHASIVVRRAGVQQQLHFDRIALCGKRDEQLPAFVASAWIGPCLEQDPGRVGRVAFDRVVEQPRQPAAACVKRLGVVAAAQHRCRIRDHVRVDGAQLRVAFGAAVEEDAQEQRAISSRCKHTKTLQPHQKAQGCSNAATNRFAMKKRSRSRPMASSTSLTSCAYVALHVPHTAVFSPARAQAGSYAAS